MKSPQYAAATLGGLLNYYYHEAACDLLRALTGIHVFNAPSYLNSLHSSPDCWWTIERGIDQLINNPNMDTSSYQVGLHGPF